MLERSIVENIVEMSFEYDCLWYGDRHRIDETWGDNVQEFKNNVLDWAEEYSEACIYGELRKIVWEKFAEMEWLRPDMNDLETRISFARDAGYNWSQERLKRAFTNRDFNTTSEMLLLYSATCYVELLQETLAFEGCESEEEYKEAEMKILEDHDAKSWDELKANALSGVIGEIDGGKVYNGKYHGEPYVLVLIQ